MTDESIRLICEMPVVFHREEKSAFKILTESGFTPTNKQKQSMEIVDYLKDHRDLIDAWQLWSFDKRTTGGYYLIIEDRTVGTFDPNINYKEKKFSNDIEACAEFIFLEVSNILS
jgi:hypothetical protein